VYFLKYINCIKRLFCLDICIKVLSKEIRVSPVIREERRYAYYFW